jgi:hypothetical protein
VLEEMACENTTVLPYLGSEITMEQLFSNLPPYANKAVVASAAMSRAIELGHGIVRNALVMICKDDCDLDKMTEFEARMSAEKDYVTREKQVLNNIHVQLIHLAYMAISDRDIPQVKKTIYRILEKRPAHVGCIDIVQRAFTLAITRKNKRFAEILFQWCFCNENEEHRQAVLIEPSAICHRIHMEDSIYFL